ncbi:hypothetical protein LTR10_003028 [Elasticomyces elasticus]|nr:hypothetical protein LTR10_003028 [Elasticomyces elasticus]KAK4967634.1 hypothetical protein LTR42_009959 [Elasticomyces elasticus]
MDWQDWYLEAGLAAGLQSATLRQLLGMSESHSPTPSPDSLQDALNELQREANENGENYDYGYLTALSTKSGAQLRAWRKAEEEEGPSTPGSRMAWDDMHAMFPSIHPDESESMQGVLLSASAPAKPRLNRWKAHQLRQTKELRAKKESNAVSDMGLFSLLPGELRNFIYRLAFVPPPEEQPVLISGSDLVCGLGACIHKRAPIAAPAIASTCSQIRNELMPIYTTECEFRFDAVMVRNRCVHSWVLSMNTYARLITKVTLEVLQLTRNGPGLGTDSQLGTITIECPAGRSDGRFEIAFSTHIPKEKIDDSKLVELVRGLNEDADAKRGRASKLAFIMGSDELAELVFRCKK